MIINRLIFDFSYQFKYPLLLPGPPPSQKIQYKLLNMIGEDVNGYFICFQFEPVINKMSDEYCTISLVLNSGTF